MAFASVLALCNQDTTTASIRVAVRPAGQTIAPKHYILYDAYVNSSDTLNLTLGLSLGPLDVVSVSSSLTSVSAVLSGSELIIDGTTVASVYNIATAASVGMVRPDNTSISVTSGVLSLIPGGSFTPATSSNLGAVRPDNTSIVVTSGVISASIANTNVLGLVRPDGTSILVTSGVISANIQTGSSSTLGIVRADGTSILVTSGVISANIRVNNTSIVISSGVISAPLSARAWVNFAVVGGTVTILNSYNVTSVTRSVAGNYTIIFIDSFPDTSFLILASSTHAGGAPTAPGYVFISPVKSTSSARLFAGKPTSATNTGFTTADLDEISMVVYYR
jgi:hypothetical protein